MAELSISVAIIVPAKGETPAEVDERVSVSTKLRLANYGRVCINRARIETNTGEETLERGVAVGNSVFPIESGSRFIYQIVTDGANIGC